MENPPDAPAKPPTGSLKEAVTALLAPPRVRLPKALGRKKVRNPAGIRPGDKVEVTVLERWRASRGLTFKQLGALIGVSDQTARNWCWGSVIPTLPAAYRIADVTDGDVPASVWLGTKLGSYGFRMLVEEAERRGHR